jgi:hypothetical protein
MLASTDNSSDTIQQSVRDVFAEVSVFFAAMTKAITTTINPDTKKPYSLYNYAALGKIIGGSGLFIHVTEEDVTYKSSSFGVQFSKELIEALLGLATGAGALSFASAMVSSLGSAGLKIGGSNKSTSSKVANIVFVCEYLLGMPIVSALVVYADLAKNAQVFQIGPCFKEQSTSTTLIMHKDTYMFVTPTFIKKYASDLDSVETDPQYNQLVHYLQDLLTETATINDLIDKSTQAAPTANKLATTGSYEIQGEFFGGSPGTLKFTQGNATIKVTAWQPDSISFTVATAMSTASQIELTLAKQKTPAATTTDSYTVT